MISQNFSFFEIYLKFKKIELTMSCLKIHILPMFCTNAIINMGFYMTLLVLTHQIWILVRSEYGVFDYNVMFYDC